MEKSKVINIGRDFSRYPAGRYVSDGPYSGEAFRDRFLVPALRDSTGKIVIEFDGARGYGSSFLEEAFGGLVRSGVRASDLLSRFVFKSSDRSLIEEIQTYVKDQSEASAGH
jgi:hypothetical protein